MHRRDVKEEKGYPTADDECVKSCTKEYSASRRVQGGRYNILEESPSPVPDGGDKLTN